MSWQTAALGEVVTLKRGYDLSSSKRTPGAVPVVSSSGITGWHDTPKVEGPGVVTGRYGTLGQVFYLSRAFWPLNTSLYVRDFKGNHPRFVAYFLRHVLSRTTGDKAAVPGVNRNHLHAMRVRFPMDAGEQEQIASVLAAYDDLIDNNQRRIRLLERSARLLYEEWFVRFRFPGRGGRSLEAGRPKGWTKRQIGDLAPLHYGRALTKPDRVAGEFPVYGSGGQIGSHESAFVRGPTILIGRKGNVGSVYWCDADCWPIDTVYYLRTEDCSAFLYHALQRVQFLNTDVAVPGLNRKLAQSMCILVPDKETRTRFEEVGEPMRDQMHGLAKENQQLARARDLLLPRLMSGEIAA